MRKCNWRGYNKVLVEKGSLSFFIDPKWIKKMKPKRRKGAGRPIAFSDQLVLKVTQAVKTSSKILNSNAFFQKTPL